MTRKKNKGEVGQGRFFCPAGGAPDKKLSACGSKREGSPRAVVCWASLRSAQPAAGKTN